MRKEIIGPCTLYLGDCRELLQQLPRVYAVVSDPQYGAGRFVSTHNSGRTGMGATMTRTDGDFKPTQADSADFDPRPWLDFPELILWGANHYCDALPRGNRWLAWDKLDGKTPVPGASDLELAWTSAKGPSRTFTHLWRGIMRAGEENVVNGGKVHPYQKPVALMAWCIGLLKATNSPILDPHMGSASTGIAAIRANRNFVGCEVEPTHFEVACSRIENELRQERMFA